MVNASVSVISFCQARINKYGIWQNGKYNCVRKHTHIFAAIKFSITPDECAIVYGYARGIYVNGKSKRLIQILKCGALVSRLKLNLSEHRK